jgi:hypothetical protein
MHKGDLKPYWGDAQRFQQQALGVVDFQCDGETLAFIQVMDFFG